MKMSKDGIKFLADVEGFKNKMYRDSDGLPTIGVGHLLTKSELTSGKLVIDGQAVKWSFGLTNDQVEKLLESDVAKFEGFVSAAVKVQLTQSEFDSLVSFAFNVGSSAFQNSTLLKLLNAGQKDQVPAQLSRWNKSEGKVVDGLTNRRNREIAVWKSAQYS